MRVKVLFISHTSGEDSITGAERSMIDLMLGLRSMGVMVEALFPKDGRSRRCCSENGITTYVGKYPMLWLIDPEKRNPIGHGARMVRFLAGLPRVVLLARIMHRSAPDIVHVNTSVNLVAGWAARRLKLPVVWHIREIPPGGWRGQLYARFIAKLASRVIAVSTEAAVGYPAAAIIPNGIDLPPVYPGRNDPQRATVGCIGYLSPRKGQIELVGMIAALRSRGVALDCVMAGSENTDRSYTAAVRRRVSESGLESSVRLVGFMNDPDDFYAQVDILAFPSTAPEGLPRAVLEAMARSIPVVAYDLGGVTDLLGDTGCRIRAGDPRAFLDAIERLAVDRDLRRSVGEAERVRVAEMFSRQRCCEQVVAVYRSIVCREE